MHDKDILFRLILLPNSVTSADTEAQLDFVCQIADRPAGHIANATLAAAFRHLERTSVEWFVIE